MSEERIDPDTGEVTEIVVASKDWLAVTGDPVGALVMQRNMIQRVMREVMREGVHFGTIPGTPKPSLWKPGAELLDVLFRLAPRYEKMDERADGDHLFVRYRCSLTHIPTGQLWGEGIGSCSTMESKYRYRNDSAFEETGLPIPKDSKEKKDEYRKQGYGMKKVDGIWKWVHFTGDSKVENPDLADTYNTVDKMACKRSLVAAVLNATAASETFTQDLEDFTPYQVPAVQAIPEGQSGVRAHGSARPAPEPREEKKERPARSLDSKGRPALTIEGDRYWDCPSCHGKAAGGIETVRVNPATGEAFCWKGAKGCGATFTKTLWAVVSVPGPSALDPPPPRAARHEAPADDIDLTDDQNLPF